MGVSASTDASAPTSRRQPSSSTSAASKSTSSSYGSSTAPASIITAAALPANDDIISPHLQRDLPHHIVECPLLPGSGRTMRSYRVRHVDTGAVIVVRAMVIKFEAGGDGGAGGGGAGVEQHPNKEESGTSKSLLPNELQIKENLQRQEEELTKLRDVTSNSGEHPNVLTFLHWFAPEPIKTDTYRSTTFTLPAYLLRPHVHSTLRDRLESRPFLSTIEKNWIAYQILRALDGLHEAGIRHGHLTCENVGVTSWNWVLLTDVASYKPISVPDDDPSDFIAHYQERSAAAGGTATGTAATAAGAPGEGAAGGTGGGSRGERQRCYLAPERFYARREGETPASVVTDAMDVFSVGCVLIEMFLNGERTFDLGDLMEYRRDGKLLPAVQQKLNKIESSTMRAACKHMLSLDPKSRLSAAEYLERLSSPPITNRKDDEISADAPAAPMPACFNSILFPLLKRLRCEALSPDARIALAAAQYGKVVKETVGLEDVWGKRYFETILGPIAVSLEGGDPPPTQDDEPKVKRNDQNKVADDLEIDSLLKETEELLRRLEASGILSDAALSVPPEEDSRPSTSINQEEGEKAENSPILLDDLAEKFLEATDNGQNLSPSASAMIIFVELVLSSMRHVQRPSSKLVALQLLLRLSKVSSDEVRLHRIVPSIVFLLQDTDAIVRASAVSALSSILAAIKSFPPSDAQLFPQYIFKRVDHLASDPSLMVRDAFAQSIALLAETALRFLDVSQAIRMYEMVDGGTGIDDENGADISEGDLPEFPDEVANLLGESKESYKSGKTRSSAETDRKPSEVLIQNTYDTDLAALRSTVSRWVVIIATDASDTSALPKQSLLEDVARLCNFFGLEGSMTYVLPQVLAFLNDRRDWQLRATLCQKLPSICAVVGRSSTEYFVAPCIETALTDSNEKVICSALSCLSSLVKLGLITRSKLLGGTHGEEKNNHLGIVEKYSVLLIHPSDDIRNEFLSLLSASFRAMGPPDDIVFLLPIIRPFLRYEPSKKQLKTVEGLSFCLLPPLSRSKFQVEVANMLEAGSTQPGTIIDSSSKAATAQSTGEGQFDDRIERILNLGATKQYMEMLYKKKRASAYSTFARDGGDAVDGALKYSYSCFAPNQKLAELMKDPLPEWYDSMRQLTKGNSDLSEENASLRCLTTLGNVYGVSITQPTTSSFEPKANYAFLDIMHGDDIPLDAEGCLACDEATSFLSSDESKAFEAAVRGEWGSMLHLDPVLTDNARHATNLKSLSVPPLPPPLGVLREQDGRPFSWHLAATSDTSGGDSTRQNAWKPKVDALVASSSPITEHSDAVVRLALSQDQSFFVTASHDGTSRVFELRQVEESVGDLRSCVAYAGHSSAENQGTPVRINDVAMIENSHSVATAASNGSVHIWRVDQVSSKRSSLPGGGHGDNQPATPTRYHDQSRVSGSSVVRTVNPREGEVLAVSHFNTDAASVVAFATQKGTIHSWDLRCAAEPFAINLRPELGYLTSMAVGHDRNWMVAGTNRGCLALWDVRYQKIVRLWQHSSASPISRLATSFTALRHDKSSGGEARPHVFMGCGQNEASVFDISQGACKQCFRVLDSELCYVDQSALPPQCVSLPQLHEISIPSYSQRPMLSGTGAFDCLAYNDRLPPPEPRVMSLIGRVGSSGQNFLLTGGSDCCIRYWSLSSASKCYTMSGLANCQPRPAYESVNVGSSARLFLCRQMPVATSTEMESSKMPRKTQRGQIRPENNHCDAILDLKMIDYPIKGVLSASRDASVKIWR